MQNLAPFFRPAREADIDRVAALYRDAVGRPGCTWDEYYPTREFAETDFRAGCLYVLELDGDIVGAASVVPEYELDELNCWQIKDGTQREIARITVAEAFQGHGLAVRMLSELIELLRSRGCHAVHLLVALCNPAALKTYARLGFEKRAETDMYDQRYAAEELVLPAEN